MVEKITVIPSEVRGLGNVVESKGVDDYSLYNSSLVLSNNVYTLSYNPGIMVRLTLSQSTITIGTNVTLTATVTNGDTPISSGETVTFYDGTTIIGTGTTNSSGVATLTVNDFTVGSHSIKAIWSTFASYPKTLTVIKEISTLTINTPALVYSDEFDVTGTLKDASNNGISGATVTLHWQVGTGSEQTTTATTGTGGTVTFHRSAPTSVTAYKFWMTYAGNEHFENATSSEVNVEVGKETTILNIVSPVDSTTYYYDSILVSGSLVTNDNEPVAGNTITVIDNTGLFSPETIATFTTDSNGEFEGRLTHYTKLSFRNWKIESTATNEYTKSSSTKTILVANPTVSISKTDGKQILSYADKTTTGNTEYCTVTGTYTGGAVSGKPMKFYKYVDGTNDVLLDTVSTDGNGQASYTYVSAGAGDIGIYAKIGTFVSETYSIRDAIYYNANSITSATTLNIPNIPTNFKCLFKHTASASQNAWVEIGADSSNALVFGRTGVNYQLGVLTRVNGSYVANQTQNSVFPSDTETEVEYTYNNGTQTIKANNTTLTITNSSITSRTYSAISNYGNGNIKDLTILPL